jgi:hypothetical protein
MTIRRISRTQHQTADQQLIDGLNQYAHRIPSLLIGGVPLPPGELVALLQGRVDAAHAAVSTKASWLSAVKADYDERARTKTAVSGLRQALHIAFGGEVDVLAAFGLAPHKQAVMTPEQKTAATAKAKATRKARHTMGRRQKAKIKGVVEQGPTATATSTATPTPSATLTGLG